MAAGYDAGIEIVEITIGMAISLAAVAVVLPQFLLMLVTANFGSPTPGYAVLFTTLVPYVVGFVIVLLYVKLIRARLGR